MGKSRHGVQHRGLPCTHCNHNVMSSLFCYAPRSKVVVRGAG